MAFWSWSKTAASNSTADSTINWAEGQAPSSVNDSARAMMARTAEWRDDVSGTITTGGTSTAYTVTSNQGFDTLAHMAGAMLCFVPHTTCGATVTLNVDGLGAKPLRSSPGIELGAGTLIQGTPYPVTYNNSDGAFYLQNFFASPFNVPVGSFLPFLSTTAPNSNFVLPFGQAISRTTYSVLFTMISTTFGIGDGSTTFNIPDLRGRAFFGLDNMGGSAASRITVAGGNFDGTALGTAGGAQNHTLLKTEIPTGLHTLTDGGHSHTFSDSNQGNPTTTVRVIDNLGGFSFGGTGSATAKTITINSAASNLTFTDNAGGGAHTSMPPAMVVPYILRVL